MRSTIARGALAASLAALAASTRAEAQVTLTPAALGTGGAYVGLARGHESLFLNPANLGLGGTPFWSLAFPQVGVGTGFVGMRSGDLPDYIDYDDLEQPRRDELLSAVPASGLRTELDVRVPLFVVQRGRFAVGVAYGAVVEQTIGRDLVDLVLNGYQAGRTDYAVGNTVGTRATFLDVAAGYGRKVGPVALGVTGHWIQGRTLSRSRLFEPRFDIEAEDVEIEYREVIARGGNGWSVDVGAAVEPTSNLVVSAAVSNAFGKMEWTDRLTTRSVTLDRAVFEAREAGAVVEELQDSEQPVDPEAVPLSVFRAAEGLYDRAFFPATLRAGAAWTRSSSGTKLSGQYQHALTEGRLAGGWDRQLGVGVEQKVPFATLRAGFASNLADARMITGGVRLGPVQVGVGRTSRELRGGASQTGWVGTFGLTVRTTGSIR